VAWKPAVNPCIEGKADKIILAISTNAFVEYDLACLESGMDCFMHKPVVPDVLYATQQH
jgi:CheY-like chemotaxis protein